MKGTPLSSNRSFRKLAYGAAVASVLLVAATGLQLLPVVEGVLLTLTAAGVSGLGSRWSKDPTRSRPRTRAVA